MKRYLCFVELLLVAAATAAGGVLASSQPITAAEQTPEPFFRRDYSLRADLGAFLKYHRIRQTFSNAMATCAAEGASIFTPRSLNDSLAVHRFIVNGMNVVGHIWIGVHDMYSEGVFVDMKGSTKFYANWGPDEPNDFGGAEDCVTLAKDTTCNDVLCGIKHTFVCARPNEDLTWNEPCDTYDLAYKFNSTLNSCYKMHTNPMKWSDAYRTCLAEESSLAIVDGDAEAQHLVRLMGEQPEAGLRGNFDKANFLVGFNDIITEGIHLTVEGKLLAKAGYDNWAPGQPNNYHEEDCGAILRDGSLNDVDCETRAMFVCEKAFAENAINVDIKGDYKSA